MKTTLNVCRGISAKRDKSYLLSYKVAFFLTDLA